MVGAAQLHVDNERRRRGDALDMREQRLRGQSRKGSDDVRHLQLTAMMKMDRRAQVKPPVQRRQRLPMVRQIGLEFPVFLIYARQAVEDLARQMGLRTPQRRAGQQVVQLPVVEHPQNVFPWRKLRPSCDSSIWRTTFLSPTSCTN